MAATCPSYAATGNEPGCRRGRHELSARRDRIPSKTPGTARPREALDTAVGAARRPPRERVARSSFASGTSGVASRRGRMGALVEGRRSKLRRSAPADTPFGQQRHRRHSPSRPARRARAADRGIGRRNCAGCRARPVRGGSATECPAAHAGRSPVERQRVRERFSAEPGWRRERRRWSRRVHRRSCRSPPRQPFAGGVFEHDDGDVVNAVALRSARCCDDTLNLRLSGVQRRFVRTPRTLQIAPGRGLPLTLLVAQGVARCVRHVMSRPNVVPSAGVR